MSTQGQLLEPVSTLLHLATLPLEGEQTKIGIYNHRVVTQSTSHYFGLAKRKYYGFNREDVSQLFDTLMRVNSWFLKPTEEDNCAAIGKTYEFRELVRNAIYGLRTLQTTYESGNVVFAIQLYINTLNDMLNDEFDPARLPEALYREWQQKTQVVKADEMKKVWSVEGVRQVQQTLQECYHARNQSDLGEEDRRMMIEGKLKSVKSVLDRHDQEFTELIKKATS